MRAFYVDNETQVQQRSYYVKLENIMVKDELKETKVVEATTTTELINKIREVYGFNPKHKFELWSAPIGYSLRIRLDTLATIPKEYENIWVKGIVN